jgi:hypothetical protein
MEMLLGLNAIGDKSPRNRTLAVQTNTARTPSTDRNAQ